jgi:F-type H+-transporting ATPase subunit epsilon
VIIAMDHLLLRIIIPSDRVAEINAEMVVIPGQEGVFAVLPGHAKFTSGINKGVVDVQEKGVIKRFFVYGGIAQVIGAQLNIVTEFAADLESTEKNNVLEKITELKSELADKEQDSVEARIINSRIDKYQTLLEFVER